MKQGWDGPVEVDYRMVLPELAQAMQQGIDASGMRKKSGRLRREFGKLANYKATKRPVGFRVTIPLPYAQIQDEGGVVPERRPRNAHAMHWMVGGLHIFAKRARAFRLPGQNYIARGIDAICARYSFGKGIQVKWRG